MPAIDEIAIVFREWLSFGIFLRDDQNACIAPDSPDDGYWDDSIPLGGTGCSKRFARGVDDVRG